MPSEKLTQAFVDKLKPHDQSEYYYDQLTHGLYVSVSPKGAKKYLCYYTSVLTHKMVRRTLGDTHKLTLAEARAKTKKIRAEVKDGKEYEIATDQTKKKIINKVLSEVKIDGKKIYTLGEIVDLYESIWAPQHKRTGKEYIAMLRKHFSHFFFRPAETISVLEIEAWRNEYRQKSGTPPVKYRTINAKVSALNAMLNWAVDRDLISRNPIVKIKRMKQVDSREVIRYLSPEERLRLYKALDDREEQLKQQRLRTRSHSKGKHLPDISKFTYADAFKPIILIALHTGIRKSALLHLKWADIDFENSTILLRAEEAKSKRTGRIPMIQAVRDILKSWYDQNKACNFITSTDDYVFISHVTGTAYDNLNKTWRQILSNANIENFRWHDMRHDFAGQLVMAGVDLNTVRELLGHSDIQTTMRYAHLAPEKKREAIEKLNDIAYK